MEIILKMKHPAFGAGVNYFMNCPTVFHSRTIIFGLNCLQGEHRPANPIIAI